MHISEYSGEKAELSISLDVIYHLVEDKIYEQYMENLINAATKFVLIYSSNSSINPYNNEHVRHRCFSEYIDINYKNLKLIEKIPNMYPYSEDDSDNTSLADFYIYQKLNYE